MPAVCGTLRASSLAQSLLDSLRLLASELGSADVATAAFDHAVDTLEEAVAAALPEAACAFVALLLPGRPCIADCTE